MFVDGMKIEQKIGCNVVRNRQVSDRLNLKGYYPVVEHWRDGVKIGEYTFENDITNEGKNLILEIMFHDGTQITSASWCAGLINITGYTGLAAADTMASHGGWTEFTGYTQANRVAWAPGAAASQQITNPTPMTFDINASGTVKGIFISSNNTKSGTSGKLWATGLFAADVPVTSGDQLKITYAVAT
jgi:hypothetical protein